MSDYGYVKKTILPALGFKFIGLDGRGHERWECRNGFLSVPSSPSEWRGADNTIADAERLSGRKFRRPNAGRYSKKRHTTGYRAERSATERETSDWVQGLLEEGDRITKEIQACADNPRMHMSRLKGLARERIRVDEELRRLHHPGLPDIGVLNV